MSKGARLRRLAAQRVPTAQVRETTPEEDKAALLGYIAWELGGCEGPNPLDAMPLPPSRGVPDPDSIDAALAEILGWLDAEDQPDPAA